MNKKINKIITNLENCFGIFDYSLTPTESNLLVLYLKELQQENKKLKENAENNDKVVDKVNWENQLLKKENERLKYNWNELKEDLIKIRQLTFTKYNKNEWENCLSFNDDILPLIEKMKELEQGSDSNEKRRNMFYIKKYIQM